MRALGIVLAGGKNDRLKELTHDRALGAMPVAGVYRAVDFSLSNMTNSGVSKVAVITQYNSRTLLEHLSSSKWWDFGRKHGGLYVFTPYITHNNNSWYRGTADAIYKNIEYLKNSHEPYAIITPSDGIYKMNYNDALISHIKTQADITVVCKRVEDEDLSRFGVVQINENNRIVEFEEKPIIPQGNIVSTGIYIIRRRLLIQLLEKCASEERYDIVQDIIIRYRKQRKIMAYMFDGYWRSISGISAYYHANLDFLNKNTRDTFFRENPIIMSKVADEPPAKFNVGSAVYNSLSASGCIINGEVHNSMLFRKVFVGRNTIIRNSIILNGTYIGDNCYIENCIVDSHSNIKNGSVHKGIDETSIVVNKEPFYI